MVDEKLTRFGVAEGEQAPLHLCNRQAASVHTTGFQFIPARGADRNLAEAEREAEKILGAARAEAELIRNTVAAERAALEEEKAALEQERAAFEAARKASEAKASRTKDK